MNPLDYPEASFASGIQNLYGHDALAQIAANSQTIAASLDAESSIPRRVVVAGAHHAGSRARAVPGGQTKQIFRRIDILDAHIVIEAEACLRELRRQRT